VVPARARDVTAALGGDSGWSSLETVSSSQEPVLLFSRVGSQWQMQPNAAVSPTMNGAPPRHRLAAACLLLLSGPLLLVASRPAAAEGEAAAEKVAAGFLELLAAPRVDVETLLGSTPAELSAFRLRLYVSPTVSGTAWTGIDYHAFRDTGKPQRVALALPSASFRARLDTLLDDPASVPAGSGAAGVRVVDVWCRKAANAGGYVPQIVKVWHDVPEAGISAEDGARNPAGRVCCDDLPTLAECERVLEFTTLLEEQDLHPLSSAGDAQESLVRAITTYRAENEAFRVTPQPEAALQTSRGPGIATIELRGTQGLPADISEQQGTTTRTLATGETFVGLGPDVRAGTVRLTIPLPFAAGGISVWAPASITDAGAIVDVEASIDGRRWTRLYRLDAKAMRDHGTHVLPASLLGKSTLSLRARLTARDDMPAAVCTSGLRFLEIEPRVPCRFQLVCSDDVLRVGERPRATLPDEVRLSISVQPESLTAADVAKLVDADSTEVDIFPPCELDEQAGRRIARHRGSVRFWAASAWQAAVPPWLATMAAGEGTIEFPGLQEPSAALVTALGKGQKSLAFPAVTSPGSELLDALAGCACELSLDGIQSLSAEQFQLLSRPGGPRLSLRGLTNVAVGPQLPAHLLKAVVMSPGTCSFPGVAQLDAATATVLAGGNKSLILGDVGALTPDVAAILATTTQGLSLDGLAKLEPTATAALCAYAGPRLSMAGLREVACFIEDLPGKGGRRPQTLRSLVTAAPTAVENAAAERTACAAELEALSRDAIAQGVENESGHEALMQALRDGADPVAVVEKFRLQHLDLPAATTVWISGTIGTPLDAFVRAPGVFALRQRGGPPAAQSRFDRGVAQSLARGRKHLDLDGLGALDVDAAAAIATAGTVVSLDGLKTMTAELAAPLLQYKGPLLSLQGIETIDPSLSVLFEPLVVADRASLPGVEMVNIAGLREFVSDTQQQKRFESFWNLSKSREWSGLTRTAKGRARVALLLPGEVVFENDGREARVVRDNLSAASRKQLTTLAKNALEVAASRKAHLLAVAAGRTEATPAAEAGK